MEIKHNLKVGRERLKSIFFKCPIGDITVFPRTKYSTHSVKTNMYNCLLI